MRYLICIVCIFLYHLAFTQNRQVEHFYDQEKKILKESYTVKGKNPPIIEGLYTSYYTNGQVKTKGYYKNNLPNDVWEYYYENGKLKMTGPLVDNIPNGYWKYYHENGNLHMEGNFENGKRQDVWKFYYE